MNTAAAAAGPTGPRPVVAFAPAKLNLFLEITGKRTDGYHDLETLMLAVDWYDTIELVPNGGQSIRLTCNDSSLPTDGRNLVYRAAELAKPDSGLDIRLTKRIPHEAGLGGGSSDAAATLIALNEAFALGRTHEELAALAAQLGSDVPFFLAGRTGAGGWCTGRGDMVEPVPVGGTFHFVAVKPPVGCPTVEVYKRTVLPTTRRNGQEARDALERGDPEKLADGLFNRLQEATFLLAPEVRDCYDRLIRSNPLGVQVTGSGSTVFAVCRDRADAIRIANECRTPDDTTVVLRSVESTR